jgi:hypothetical protein
LQQRAATPVSVIAVLGVVSRLENLNPALKKPKKTAVFSNACKRAMWYNF